RQSSFEETFVPSSSALPWREARRGLSLKLCLRPTHLTHPTFDTGENFEFTSSAPFIFIFNSLIAPFDPRALSSGWKHLPDPVLPLHLLRSSAANHGRNPHRDRIAYDGLCARMPLRVCARRDSLRPHQSSKEYRALPGRHHCAHRSVCIHSDLLRALAHHLVRFCAEHGMCIVGIPFQSTQTHLTVEKQGTPFRRILRRERTHHRGREQRCARF